MTELARIKRRPHQAPELSEPEIPAVLCLVDKQCDRRGSTAKKEIMSLKHWKAPVRAMTDEVTIRIQVKAAWCCAWVHSVTALGQYKPASCDACVRCATHGLGAAGAQLCRLSSAAARAERNQTTPHPTDGGFRYQSRWVLGSTSAQELHGLFFFEPPKLAKLQM